MKQMFLLLLCLLILPFQVASQTCEWSELIGKDLVLYRYGRLKDGIFTDYRFTNPAGAESVETLTLTDSTHFEWKYSLSGDFKRDIDGTGDTDGIMNVTTNDEAVAPLINIRIISPGAAAKLHK